MRLLFTLFLMTLGTCAFAQKSYIYMYTASGHYSTDYVYLYGAVPSHLKSKYSYSDFGIDDSSKYATIGATLNLLGNEGFSVEHANDVYDHDSKMIRHYFVLSKLGVSDNPSNVIQRVEADNDEDVTEVARYNLQGVPVDQNEKGLQIVVYSNYTTKTIIIE